MQQVRLIKDRNGNVVTSENSVLRRWMKYFEKLVNEETKRERRMDGGAEDF